MAGKLQKRPRTPAELGLYRFSGDLSALAGGPGRRVVRDLELRGPEGSLDVLRAFPDLRHLSIRDAGPLALDPLADLSLTQLILSDCRGFHVAPLARLDGLETLGLVGLEAPRVPDRLPLTASLDTLVLGGDDGPAGVEPLVRAIDWRALGQLRSLDMTAERAPARIDLALLHHLPRLERLELARGVIHDGRGPSPLEPPFRGLPRTVTFVRFESDDPDRVNKALRKEVPAASVAVFPRPHYEDAGQAGGDWDIIQPEAPGDVWQVYGRLADAYDQEIEHDALRLARRRLREADPELLGRLDFDQEAEGTGISARSREDVERALEILGLSG